MPRPWKTPDLPPGPLHRFNRELHTLHRKAGYPSARALQDAVGGEDVVSHTTIHHAFIKPARPSWGVVELVVEALAKCSRPRVDAEAEVDRFKALWDAVESDTEGDECLEEQSGPRRPARTQRHPNGGTFDLRSLSAPLEVQELIQELQRIKEEGELSLEAFSYATGYSKGMWEEVLKGCSFPSREAVLRLSERHQTSVFALMALWDRADRALEASLM